VSIEFRNMLRVVASLLTITAGFIIDFGGVVGPVSMFTVAIGLVLWSVSS
jgi:hypothetical protein